MNMRDYIEGGGKFHSIDIHTPSSDGSHGSRHHHHHHQHHTSSSHGSRHAHDQDPVNKYVPFNPKEHPRNSQAWSSTDRSEEYNYRSQPHPHVPQKLLVDNIDKSANSSNKSNQSLVFWIIIIVITFLIIVIIIIIIVYYFTDNSTLSLARLSVGPGDNSPCLQYTVLSDPWRQIGRRPLSPGVGYNCDNGLQAGWFRFMGEAGVQLADQRSPPTWEGCGTSRVAWLEGGHPSLIQGTVQVSPLRRSNLGKGSFEEKQAYMAYKSRLNIKLKFIE